MRFVRATLLFIIFVSAALAAETKLALQPGESLNYRVAWGIFPHAGEINVGARSEMDDGKTHTVVTTVTAPVAV